jgi:hypothetical protein
MPTTAIASIIQIRSGTQAELDALPNGQKPLLGEPIWTTDTKRIYVGVDVDTNPSLMGSSFVMMSEVFDENNFVSYSFRGGAQKTTLQSIPNAAGSDSLDIQSKKSSVSQVASGNSSIAIGTTCTASGPTTLALGHSAVASGSGSIMIGRSNTNSVANSMLIGHSLYCMRGTNSDGGWIQTICSNASPHAAHLSTISDCPAGSLPTGYFGFRRNGNQILIDINTDGTVRTLSLGTAT